MFTTEIFGALGNFTGVEDDVSTQFQDINKQTKTHLFYTIHNSSS